MPSNTVPDLNLTLGALLRRPYERMSDWVYAQLALDGFEDIRPAYSAVIRNIPAEGAHVSELAASAGMTKQSMAYLVEQMESGGLVELKPHPQDRRAKIVSLSTRGLAAGQAAVDLSRRYELYLGTLVGERKMTLLRDILSEVYEKLENDGTGQARASA